MVDANGNPVVLTLTEGRAHGARSATDMLDSVGAGQILLAARAYDSDALRETLQARVAWANVEPMPGRLRRPTLGPWLYPCHI